jgi:hypothetical protein
MEAEEGVRPFDAGGWFPISNALFDVIMRRLSPCAWKVLCVVARQTWGWVADPNGDPRVRREWDRISYSQFQIKSGIRSRTTVKKALDECLAKGCLLRRQERTERGWPVYAYALNCDSEADRLSASSAEAVIPTGSQNEPITGTGNEPVTGPGNGPTKQRETEIKHGDDAFTPEQERCLELLTDSGVSEPVARRIAHQSTPSDVRGWLDYARSANGLRDPVGLVVRRLLDGERAPSERGNRRVADWRDNSQERRRRYASQSEIQT